MVCAIITGNQLKRILKDVLINIGFHLIRLKWMYEITPLLTSLFINVVSSSTQLNDPYFCWNKHYEIKVRILQLKIGKESHIYEMLIVIFLFFVLFKLFENCVFLDLPCGSSTQEFHFRPGANSKILRDYIISELCGLNFKLSRSPGRFCHRDQ